MAVTDRVLCLFKNDGAKSEKENFSLFLVKLLIKYKFQPFSKRMIFYRIGVKKLLFFSQSVKSVKNIHENPCIRNDFLFSYRMRIYSQNLECKVFVLLLFFYLQKCIYFELS